MQPQDKSGKLCKLSPSFFAGWQERYVVLKDRKMKYYKQNPAGKGIAP